MYFILYVFYLNLKICILINFKLVCILNKVSMLCYVMLCYVMLCYMYVMLHVCYVMLCYVMLCYVNIIYCCRGEVAEGKICPS